MIRPKLGLPGLCVLVLGLMAMFTSVAQASESTWTVLESLKAELTAEKDSTHLTLLAEVVGLKVAVSCTGFALKGVNLEAEGKLAEGGKAVFTGCAVYKEVALGENLGCTVKSSGAAAGTVETNELKGELVLHELGGGGKEVLAKIQPKGTDFVGLRFEGCALTEINAVRGVLYIKDTEGFATHAIKHLVEQGPLTTLYLGAHSATKLERTKVDGGAWMALGGADEGLQWGVTE